MKHIKNFIKKIPLTQQLFLMVVSLSIFLVSFFFRFMTYSVDTFVEAQMYNVIHQNQKSVIENYLVAKSGASPFAAEVSEMAHIT